MRYTLVFIALALVPLHGWAQAPEASPAPAPAVKPAEASQPPDSRSRRLRFRSDGPTCLCATGLSERDIQAAQVRFPGSSSPPAGPAGSTPPDQSTPR